MIISSKGDETFGSQKFQHCGIAEDREQCETYHKIKENKDCTTREIERLINALAVQLVRYGHSEWCNDYFDTVRMIAEVHEYMTLQGPPKEE